MCVFHIIKKNVCFFRCFFIFVCESWFVCLGLIIDVLVLNVNILKE